MTIWWLSARLQYNHTTNAPDILQSCNWCISFIFRCLEYGDIFTYRLLHMNVVVVIRPDAIKVRYLRFKSKLFFYSISLKVNLSFESQRKLNAILIFPFAMRNVRNILMRVDTYNKCSIAEGTFFYCLPKWHHFCYIMSTACFPSYM